RPAGWHAVQPGGREGAGRLHQGTRARRDCECPPTSGRGRGDRRGDGDAADRASPRIIDVHRPRCRDRSWLHERERCVDDLAFRHFYTPDPIPPEGAVIADVAVTRTLLGGIRRKPVHRTINRSSPAAAGRRQQIRIGIPRVLNLYSSAPVWRTYFESLGLSDT